MAAAAYTFCRSRTATHVAANSNKPDVRVLAMGRRSTLAQLAGALVLLPALADADIRPIPRSIDPTLLAAIENAGHPCRRIVDSHDAMGSQAERLRREGLAPHGVICD